MLTINLKSPIIAEGFLTFDALLGALLFEDCEDIDISHGNIPIQKTGDLFHASAAIFDPGNKAQTGFCASLRAVHDLDPDLLKKKKGKNQTHRRVGTLRKADYGNVLSVHDAYRVPKVQWIFEGDAESIHPLLENLDFIGKRRASGFGEVSSYQLVETDLCPLYDTTGAPRRPIPADQYNGDYALPIQEAAWRPAYWNLKNRAICYTPSTRIQDQ